MLPGRALLAGLVRLCCGSVIEGGGVTVSIDPNKYW